MPLPSDKETHRLHRLWRIPPALLRNPGAPESFEGENILGEFRGDTALMLWQCHRDVLLWASTPPNERGELFWEKDGHTAAQEPGEPLAGSGLGREALRALRRLRRGARRLRDDDGSMGTAAMVVGNEAERVGAAATAISYAQLSAAVDPSSASAALSVGRLALRLGHAAVAETWLRRAIALGRRSRDWGAYAAALAGLGSLRERNNRLDEARGEYVKVLRMGRRHGLLETVGQAVRGLLRVALGQGDQDAAERYAAAALRTHRREHPHRASVLLDVAEVEVRRGAHERAAITLRKALPGLTDAEAEVRALVLLVRALGAAGEWSSVEGAWHRALDVIDDAYGYSGEAVCWLLMLARAGAEALQELHADRAAQRALLYAKRIGDGELIADCKTFLARPRVSRAA